MTHPRLRTLAGITTLAATLGLAACAETAPQPAAETGVQTEAIDDTRTVPSEAARAQQSGDAATSPEGTPGATAPMDGGPPAAMLNQLAGLGGAMHAAVELCDPSVGPAQLADARERQQQEFVNLGGDAATFEQEFTTAHGRVQAQYRSATPAQQQQMCAELEQMSQQVPTPTPPQG
ncbi:hypothetical protein ACF3M1_17135 [Luteimonas sp. WGS1318]|uniref:hypothetical protein n=1 Tax=Luteimonas sp. WGS1318 TaxID=3366815 RepID=UPI00372D2848